MDIKSSLVGVKYFRYTDDNELELIRILNDSNPNDFKYKKEGEAKRGRISRDTLDKEYSKLTPDGVIYFNIVTVGELEDVMIMMYRSKDINEKATLPYLVCRQNVTDLFANTINPDYNNLITGLAISQDSLPEKISMETILACDNIKKTVSVSAYIDDTIYDILSLIKTKPYDIVLYNLFADHVRYKYKGKIKEYMNKTILDGYCKTLKSIMIDNEFMYEFYRGFGIFPVTFEITKEELLKNSLSFSHMITMSKVTMRKIQKTFITPFDKTFDLSEIKRDYFLLIDSNDKLFIVAYTWNGEIEVPVADIESKENIEKMSKISGYNTNKHVLNALKFNVSKYNE